MAMTANRHIAMVAAIAIYSGIQGADIANVV